MITYTAEELQSMFSDLWGCEAHVIRHRIGGGKNGYTVEGNGHVCQLRAFGPALALRFVVDDEFWASALTHEQDAADYAEYLENGWAALAGVA